MSAVRFSLGPLTTYAEPGELREWIRSAAPGDRDTYAIGPALSENAEAKRIAAAAYERGEVDLFQKREGRGWRYIIVKLAPDAARPRRGGRQTRLRLDPDFEASDAGRLFRLLCERARDGLPLPSLTEMAEMADLPDRHAADYRLRCLAKSGRVVIRGKGDAREIEIVGKGWVLKPFKQETIR